MKRYHEEQHIIANRVKRYKQLGGYLGPQHDKYVPAAGRFRKTIRCNGCGRAGCQLCHPDKFPKRKPTRQERQAQRDFNNEE
jgi:hypothetical protein